MNKRRHSFRGSYTGEFESITPRKKSTQKVRKSHSNEDLVLYGSKKASVERFSLKSHSKDLALNKRRRNPDESMIQKPSEGKKKLEIDSSSEKQNESTERRGL